MLQFIKKNYLSQTKLSNNLIDLTGGITLAIFCGFLGFNMRVSLWIITVFVSLGIIRAAMAFLCIMKYNKKNKSE